MRIVTRKNTHAFFPIQKAENTSQIIKDLALRSFEIRSATCLEFLRIFAFLGSERLRIFRVDNPAYHKRCVLEWCITELKP